MIIRLPLPSDFQFDAVVRSHGWYDLPPFRYDRKKGVLHTSVGITSGSSASVLFRVRDGRLEADSDRLDAEAVTRLARRVFSLDIELARSAEALAGEPELARTLAHGGGRLLRCPTLFEDAVKMLLTTNCSWAATKAMVTRLIAEAGAESRAFPDPAAVAALRVSVLKSEVRCGYRAEPLRRLARRVAMGRLDLARWERQELPADEIRGAILAEKGFGPYAAEGLLRVLGRHDFLALDSWTRQKYRRLYPGPAKSTDRSIARRYARFGAHRGLALWLDLTRDWHSEKEELWP